MNMRKAAGLAAMLAACAAPALAQTGWTTVGHAALAAEAGIATITPRWQPQFREIMFCTEDHDVRLLDAAIRFRDGRTQTIKIRARVADGGCSRMASVGRNRDIAGVDIAYDPASLGGGRARLLFSAR